MTEMKNINENQVCNECGRHCPLTALHCDRGRRAAGLLDEEAKIGESEEHRGRGGREERKERREHEDSRRRGEFGERRNCGEERGRRNHEEHRERRGREVDDREKNRCGHHHDHRFDLEAEGDAGLYARLRQCGHYLFHSGKERSAQKNVLVILSEHEEGITQRELTEVLGIHRASVSELLGKLEKKGLVCRIPDEQDRRQVRVSLTAEGKKELPDEAVKNDERKELFSVLTEDEKTSLFTILGKLIKAWGCSGEDRK